MAVELEGLESSADPNPTQNGDIITLPVDEKGNLYDNLEEVVETAKKRVVSNYDTRDADREFWTSEVEKYEENGTFEQWKVLHGKPGETFLEARKRNKSEWGSYWEQKYSEWDKQAREDRLRQKLWIFTSYFWIAEDVLNVYAPTNALASATARVSSKAYSFTGILSKSSDDIIAYRNFGSGEYNAFRKSGNQFTLAEFGEKQFWLDDAGLEFWKSKKTFVGEFTIKIKIPKSMLQFEHPGGLDGFRALSLDKYTLPKLNRNFKIEWIEIRPGNATNTLK